MSRREFRKATTGLRVVIEVGVVVGNAGAQLVAVELCQHPDHWHWAVRSLPDGGVLRIGSATTESAARMAATEGGMQ